jgi:glycogen(starch) synthase
MTRVLMTADTVGGVWTYALELADAVAPYGIDVHLATMGRRLSPSQWQEVRRSAVVDVHESELALEWMPEPWADVDRAGAWLQELVDEVQPELLHLNGYSHAALPWQVPTVVVAHSDVVSWWRAVHRAAPSEEWDEYRARVAAGLRGADAVVAPTAAVLDDLRESYAFDRGVVIPNCRRGDWIQDVAKEPLVLGAGRVWDEAKGLAALAAAGDRLPWQVCIAGEGGALGPLPFEELTGWLNRASVFAAPASYEPFGLGILEAGLAGCALVLGDIPSLREVWGEDALFVRRDSDALAGAVRWLIDSPPRRHEMAARARRRAQRYTSGLMAKQYVAVYQRLAATAPGAAPAESTPLYN